MSGLEFFLEVDPNGLPAGSFDSAFLILFDLDWISMINVPFGKAVASLIIA